jgi:hypothetical protein
MALAVPSLLKKNLSPLVAFKITVSPSQNIIAPCAWTIGEGGNAKSLGSDLVARIRIALEFIDRLHGIRYPQLRLSKFAKHAPLLHKNPTAARTCRLTLRSAQKTRGPSAVMIGLSGGGIYHNLNYR